MLGKNSGHWEGNDFQYIQKVGELTQFARRLGEKIFCTQE